jgi:putative transcriptional regulator
MMNITSKHLCDDATVVEKVDDGSERTVEPATIREMTECDVLRAAIGDPENPPMTETELARARPVAKSKQVRWALGLGREEFAARYHIPIELIAAWERYQSEPDDVACSYLAVIAEDPDGVARALQAVATRNEQAAE